MSAAVEHEHAWDEVRRDSNGDRIRTTDVCTTCGFRRSGCYAKRLDDEGREAWGAVGVWTYSLAEPGVSRLAAASFMGDPASGINPPGLARDEVDRDVKPHNVFQVRLTPGFTAADLVACVTREIKMRERVYPTWVQRGRMTSPKALAEIATMKAVLAVLELLPASPPLQPDLFGAKR